MLAALALAGCPRTDPPPDHMAGMPCTTNEECNPGRTCGDLTLCVGGYCEASHTLVVACPGQGMRIP